MFCVAYDYRALIEDSNTNEYMVYSNQSYDCEVLYCSINSREDFRDYETAQTDHEVCSSQENADDYALAFTSNCRGNASNSGSIGTEQYDKSIASYFTITNNSLEANLPVKLASNAEETFKICYSIVFNSNSPVSKDYLKSIHADRGEIPLGCDSLADESYGENVLKDSIQAHEFFVFNVFIFGEYTPSQTDICLEGPFFAKAFLKASSIFWRC